jgi:hypothetical protein
VEQQNILDRIAVTSDFGRIMWIHTISLDGKIIFRQAVRNKITSSGKRLEPVEAAGFASGGNGISYPIPEYKGYGTKEFIQPDGTFGNSDPYIFWFDPQGRYHQWGTAGGLGYLLTDYPIDLKNPIDEVTGMYNMNQAAYNWQKTQEAGMKK